MFRVSPTKLESRYPHVANFVKEYIQIKYQEIRSLNCELKAKQQQLENIKNSEFNEEDFIKITSVISDMPKGTDVTSKTENQALKMDWYIEKIHKDISSSIMQLNAEINEIKLKLWEAESKASIYQGKLDNFLTNEEIGMLKKRYVDDMNYNVLENVLNFSRQAIIEKFYQIFKIIQKNIIDKQ